MSTTNLTLLTGKEKLIKLVPEKADGSPSSSPFFGVPQWQVTGDSQVVPAADGLSAVVTGGATASVTKITVTAQGDPEVGVNVLTTEIDVNVILEEAAQIGVEVSDVAPAAAPSEPAQA